MERGAVAVAERPRASRRSIAYTPVMRAIHWATATLLLCSYTVAWTIDDVADPAMRAWLLMLHRSLGVILLLATLIWLLIRQRTHVPPLPADLPMAQKLAARLSIVSLYAQLMAQPLLGLVASALHGDRVVLFGSLVLPRFLPESRALAHALFKIHGMAASVFLVLIALHAAAALYHHYVRKDHVLAAMLPGLRMSSGRVP